MVSRNSKASGITSRRRKTKKKVLIGVIKKRAAIVIYSGVRMDNEGCALIGIKLTIHYGEIELARRMINGLIEENPTGGLMNAL